MPYAILLLAIFVGVALSNIVRLIVDDYREKGRARARDRIRQKVNMTIPQGTPRRQHRARSGHPLTMQSW